MKSWEEDKMNKKRDLTSGSMLFKMILFAIPVILSGVLQLLFNAADIIVVGNFAGDESLAAVGSTSSLINLFTNIFIGLSVAANVLVAHYTGSKDNEKISETVHTSILVSIVGGIFLFVFGFFFSHPMLKLMGNPEDVIELASLYLKIYFVGMPAMLAFNFGSAVLRAVGDTKRPLYFLSASGVINVILNMILVIGFRMGVAGVAIATVVSQFISAYLIIIYLRKQDGPLKLELCKLKINPYILRKLIGIGIPSGIQGIVFSLSNVVIQSSVNSFGSVVVAGNSATMNIEGFVYLAMNGMYQTAITFVGQNFGAGKKDRVIRSVILCEILVFLVGLISGNVTYFFIKPLLRVYSSSPDVIAAGVVRAGCILPVYFLCGIMDVMVGALRGIGKSVAPMITSILGACVFRLIWIATIFQMYKRTEILYISYAISWTITFVAHVCIFLYYLNKLGFFIRKNKA